MAITLVRISRHSKAKRRYAERFVAAWVAVSFFASVTVCCDVFASDTRSHAVVEISAGSHSTGRAADHHHPHADFQYVKHSHDRKDTCVSDSRPVLADLKYIAPNSPIPVKIFLSTDQVELLQLSVPPAVSRSLSPAPPPNSSPRYLLFHRLLVDHFFT